MKVCIWFGLIAVNYNPPSNQLLFVDGDLLMGLGPRQCEVKLTATTVQDAEAVTGLHVDDVTTQYGLKPTDRLWLYNDNDDGDGFTAVFADLEDLKR